VADTGESARVPDDLIVEEPLEIRLDDHLVTTTMRTPGHDFELAVGFCFTEGLLAGAPVTSCRYCGIGSAVHTEFNVVSVETGGQVAEPEARLRPVSSSCGLCGSASIEELVARLSPVPSYEPWDVKILASVPGKASGQQELFGSTGAVHAAASFDRDGTIVDLREDIGRHNAVDEVIGRMVLDDRLPASDLGLFVSGRASFEMAQKAWAAGFEVVVAVSAPSALAVETAKAAGITLAGFARGGALNLYTGLGA
jgi:FdhD protein